MEYFLNKNCKIIVSFSRDYGQGGSVPTLFNGIVFAYDEQFIKVKIPNNSSGTIFPNSMHTNPELAYGDIVLINRNYVVAIITNGPD